MIGIQNFRNVAASRMQNRVMDRIRGRLQRGNAELKLRESGGEPSQARSQKTAVPAIERKKMVNQLKAQNEALKKLRQEHGMVLQRLTAQSNVNGNSNSAPVRYMSGNSDSAHKANVEVTLKQALEEIKKEKVVAIDGVNVASVLGKQAELSKVIRLALQDANEPVRIKAALELARHCALPEVYIPILLDALETQSEKVSAIDRANVACALGQQPKITEDICIALQSLLLQDDDEQVKMQAVIALRTTVRDADEQVRMTAAIVLGSALRDANEQVKIQADIALEAALRDPSEQVRIQAALALGSYRELSEVGIRILLAALENENDEVKPDDRVNAIDVLGAQPELSQDICAVLEAALEDNNKEVKFSAAMVLEEALQNADEQVRIRVALALGRHRTLPEAGIRILLAALKNQSEKVSPADRVNATWILGEQLELFKILEGDEKEVRIKAVLALKAALQDPDEQVRIKAATALDRYADILS